MYGVKKIRKCKIKNKKKNKSYSAEKKPLEISL